MKQIELEIECSNGICRTRFPSRIRKIDKIGCWRYARCSYARKCRRIWEAIILVASVVLSLPSDVEQLTTELSVR